MIEDAVAFAVTFAIWTAIHWRRQRTLKKMRTVAEEALAVLEDARSGK